MDSTVCEYDIVWALGSLGWFLDTFEEKKKLSLELVHILVHKQHTYPEGVVN